MQRIQSNFVLRQETERLGNLQGNCGRTIRRFFEQNVNQGVLLFSRNMIDPLSKIQVLYLLNRLVNQVNDLNYARRAYDAYPVLLIRCFDLDSNCFVMAIDDINVEGSVKEKQDVLAQITDLVWQVQPDCEPLRGQSDLSVLTDLLRQSGYTESRTNEEFAAYCEVVYAELLKYLEHDFKANPAKIPTLLKELCTMLQ